VTIRVGGEELRARTNRTGRFRARWKPDDAGRSKVKVRSAGNLVAAGSTAKAGRVTVFRSAEASWYSAASLLKLGRAEDAVEAFVLAERSSRAGGDALLEVYRGQACYAAQLLLCADRWFESAEARAGPRLAPQLRALRTAIREALRPDQIEPAVDRFLDRASALQRTRPALAFAFAEEASALAGRSPARHRQAEAMALTGRLVAPTTGDGR